MSTVKLPKERLRLLSITLASACIAGVALSYSLWISDRLYPLTPLFELPYIPSPLDHALVFLLVISLVGQAVAPRLRFFLPVALGCIVVLALFDQSRWQPWFYQYALMLAGLAIARDADEQSQLSALNIGRLIIVAVYVWSGIHKCNAGFFNQVAPWFYQGITGSMPSGSTIDFFYLLPIIEIFIGAGLLFKATRFIAIVLAVLMHVGILLATGPLGHDTNSVIWLWNIAMIAFILLLFQPKEKIDLRQVFWGRPFIHKVVLLLVGFAPVLNAANLWDAYPSFALYSGNTNIVTYYIDKAGAEQLPPELAKYVEPYDDRVSLFQAILLARDVVNTPIYPEKRIFESIAAYVTQYFSKGGKLTMILHPRKTAFGYRPVLMQEYP